MMTDCNGEQLAVGSAVVVLNAGNFIYGHVTAINESTVEVTPDIGYISSKKYFKLKETYTVPQKNISLITGTNEQV